ncbi:MAG: response regulator, partial [Bacteroidales bacterium]|nr:response regulator [Bacteroidales bacterium]
RKQLAYYLFNEGFKILNANDGVEGIQMTLQHKPDVIISDILMPRIDGYDFLRSLKQIKATQNIPFIFITANNQVEDIRKSMLLGADDYLIKPVNINTLMQSIRMAIKKHNSVSKSIA